MDRKGKSANADARRIARALSDVARAERDLARAAARDLGVSAVDLHALGHLLWSGATGVLDMGRRLGLSSAAATGLADRLEAAGHAVRRPHPTDRRRLVLEPTAHARDELLSRVQPVADEVEDMARRFDPDQRAAIERFLSQVIEIYDRHAGMPSRASAADHPGTPASPRAGAS